MWQRERERERENERTEHGTTVRARKHRAFCYANVQQTGTKVNFARGG